MIDDDTIPMPEALEDLLEKAHTKVGHRGIAAMTEFIIIERNKCSTRGYHLVDEEPQKPNPHERLDLNNLLICYDCEEFFGKYDEGLPYRVEKL